LSQQPLELAPNPLPESYIRAINYVHQQWKSTGRIPSDGDICHYGYLNPAEIDRFWSHPATGNALAERGVQVRLPGDTLLTDRQLIAINVVMNPADNRSLNVKLKSIGIGLPEWSGWFRDENFRKFLEDRGEELLTDYQPLIHDALTRRAMSGDTRAIEYYNKINGRFDPNAAANVNVALLLTRVFDIIQRNIADGDTLKNISRELQALAEGKESTELPSNHTAPVGKILEAS
jgi:hypothetical protein